MTISRNIIQLLAIIFVTSSCVSNQFNDELILNDILPQLVDSLNIKEHNILPPPPPPPIYDADSNIIGYNHDKTKSFIKEYNLKIEKINQKYPITILEVIDTLYPLEHDISVRIVKMEYQGINEISELNELIAMDLKSRVLNLSLLNEIDSLQIIKQTDLRKQYPDIWETQDRKFAGNIKLSRIYLNKENNKGLFSFEYVPMHDGGAGYIIIIKNVGGKWIVSKIYKTWVA